MAPLSQPFWGTKWDWISLPRHSGSSRSTSQGPGSVRASVRGNRRSHGCGWDHRSLNGVKDLEWKSSINMQVYKQQSGKTIDGAWELRIAQVFQKAQESSKIIQEHPRSSGPRKVIIYKHVYNSSASFSSPQSKKADLREIPSSQAPPCT